MNSNFFDYIDEEIKRSQTKKSISYLEKRASKYVGDLPSTTDKKTLKSYKKRLVKTRKLARMYKRRLK